MIPDQRSGLRLCLEDAWGLCLAFYYLVGRWSPSRLADEYATGDLFDQPRFWVVGVMAILLALGPISSRSREGNPRLFLFFSSTLLVYMICSATWAPFSVDNQPKAMETGLLLAVHLLSYRALSTLNPNRVIDSFWVGILGCTLLMALLGIISIRAGRLSVLGGGPNVFGRNMVLMLLATAYFEARINRPWGWRTGGALVLSSILVVLSGSRGAILSMAAGLTVLAFSARGHLTRRFAFASYVVAGLAIMLTTTSVGSRAVQMFHDRIVVATIQDRYTSERDELFIAAARTGVEYPIFGVGLDAFRQWVSTDYPHNFVLELFAEGGGIAIGLMLGCALSIVFYISQYRSRINPFTLSALAVTFTAAQFSGDLYDSRGIFLFAMLAVIPDAVPRTARQEYPVLPESTPLAG